MQVAQSGSLTATTNKQTDIQTKFVYLAECRPQLRPAKAHTLRYSILNKITILAYLCTYQNNRNIVKITPETTPKPFTSVEVCNQQFNFAPTFESDSHTHFTSQFTVRVRRITKFTNFSVFWRKSLTWNRNHVLQITSTYQQEGLIASQHGFSRVANKASYRSISVHSSLLSV